MNTKNLYNRFKSQYESFEWKKLISHPEFLNAVEAEDYDMAGRMADRILVGEAKTKSEGRKMKKEHDESKRVLKNLLAD